MPFIGNCEVTGLAGRTETIRLNLNRHVNVFFGPNGSGKTSLLRLLHSALSNDKKQLNRTASTAASVEIEEVYLNHPEYLLDSQTVTRVLQYNQEPKLWRDASFILGGERAQKKLWVSSSDVEGSEDAGQEIDHVYLPISRLYATDEYRFANSLSRIGNSTSKISEEDLDKIFVDSINLLWLRYTRNVLADVRRTQDQGYSNILLNFLSPSGLMQNPHKSKTRSLLINGSSHL